MSSPTRRDPQHIYAWQSWIAENVLLGVDTRDIHRMLIAQGGYDPQESEREITAAFASPYLAVARRLGVKDEEAAAPPPAGSSARAAKYAWWLEVQRRTAKLASTHGVIPRIPYPSNAAFLDDFYAPNRPCVIEGAIDDWPAFTKWTPDYLKAACGDRTVEVEANRDREGITTLSINQTMPFGEFVDLVEAGGQTNDLYLTAQNDGGNRDALAALWDDVRLPDFLTQDQGPIGGAHLWYGPGGTLSATHHDLTNNLMAQVLGRKRVLLVAPNESAHLHNDYGRRSLVSLEEPDLEKFPSLADVTIMEVEIGPGDLLFIPAGWWHSVRALDVSFTFTFTNFIYDANDYYRHHPADGPLDEA